MSTSLTASDAAHQRTQPRACTQILWDGRSLGRALLVSLLDFSVVCLCWYHPQLSTAPQLLAHCSIVFNSELGINCSSLTN